MKERIKLTHFFRKVTSMALTLALMLGVFPVFGTGADTDYDLPWLWPVPGSYKINCLDYYYTGGIHNQGQCMDISANGYTGDNRLDVVSATSGEVVYMVDTYNETTNKGSGWGNYVIILSGNTCIVYGHLKSISVERGKTIKAGDVIGKMGSTGNSTGVHLHLQAYPLGKGNTSTEIYVFDEYKENPLYYPKFQFMKALSNYSVRYGEWIREFYTNVSGSYYTYSGGVVSDYELTYVDARMRVFSTSGVVLRALPVEDNQYNRETAAYGDYISIVGYTTDAYGKIWLKTDPGLWMSDSGVGFYDYNDSLEIYGETLPTDTYGNLADIGLSGIVSSGNPITAFSAQILDGEKIIAEYKLSAISKTVLNLDDGISSALLNEKMKDGKYTFRLVATASAQYPSQPPFSVTKILAESVFTMDSYLSDRVPPIIESVDASVTADGISVSATVSDNREVKSVEIEITHGEITKKITRKGNEQYIASVKFADFAEKSGEYLIKVSALDGYDNRSESERTIVIPPEGEGEVWECTYSGGVNTRLGPGTSYSKGDKIALGTQVTISEFVDDGTYIWGKMANGYWTALTYYKYISGFSYWLYFDGNGSQTEIKPVGKRYGTPATLPPLPVREGYSFLGWSESSSSKTAEYGVSATYGKNVSALLFAVWEDKNPPVIKSVTVSPEKWVSDGVTVTVDAADSGGTVYYSFDGGKFWYTEGNTFIRENTILDEDLIKVRDASGNVTQYGEKITINNIDKIPPSVSSASASVSVSGTKASFIISGVSDDGSGIEKYEIVLSGNASFDKTTVKEITPGSAVSIGEGIWYWKLRITDRAGNASSKSFGRFRIGTPERLDIPSALKIVNTGSSFVELIWNGVENADGYSIAVSDNAQFDGYSVYNFSSCAGTVQNLDAGREYYVRVSSSCSDMVYSASEFSTSLTFTTLSDDSAIYGFSGIENVLIEDTIQQCSAVLPFTATEVSVIAQIGKGASAKYYSDSSYKTELQNPEHTPFTSSSAVFYIEVTAENGSQSRYTLKLTRAGENAEVPTVTLESNLLETVSVGGNAGSVSVTGRVSDGGTVSYAWYAVINGGETVPIGIESSVTVPTEKAGTVEIYAVVSNTNPRCLNTVSKTESRHLTVSVEKILSPISVAVADFEYNGKTASAAVKDYSGDGETSVRYYRDELCTDEIAAPSAVGVYYVRAEAAETETYAHTVSATVKLTIQKAHRDDTPEYTVVQPSLRKPTTEIAVDGNDVEYSLNGSDWAPLKEKTFVLNAGDVLKFRFTETANIAAGDTVTVTVEAYSGATDITPSGVGMYRDGGILFIDYVVTGPTDVKTLLEGLEKSDNIMVCNGLGQTLSEDDTVSTGCRIVLSDEEGEYVSADIVVRGDINCDGTVSWDDVMLIMKLSNGMALPENGFEILAGDLDGDGVLTSSDAQTVSRFCV